MIERAKPTAEELRLAGEERTRLLQEQFESVKNLNFELLDEDGYPTDHACHLVEIWLWTDIVGWFKFIENLWCYRDFGWHEVDEAHEYRKDSTVHRYYISTAGWSGNESLIAAMEKNHMLWTTSWVQSRRGGHYIFELDDKE